MPADARRARRERRGKADRLAASRNAFRAGKIELRCPKCNSREVAYHKTIGIRDQYGCGKCWITFSVDSTRLTRTNA